MEISIVDKVDIPRSFNRRFFKQITKGTNGNKGIRFIFTPKEHKTAYQVIKNWQRFCRLDLNKTALHTIKNTQVGKTIYLYYE